MTCLPPITGTKAPEIWFWPGANMPGKLIPSTLIWLLRVNRAKNNTKNPATFENVFERWGFEKNATLESPINKSIGKVPRAKNPIIPAPCQGFPDNSANVWAVIVKPQGKKKVRAPMTKGMCLPLKLLSSTMRRVMALGVAKRNLRKQGTSSICKPRATINKEMAITKKEVNPNDICNLLPINPNRPPKSAYDKILPVLNMIWGCIFT